MTLDEADNVTACLDALASQSRPPNEVVLIDAGSRDGTVSAARNWRTNHALPVRIIEHRTRIPIGAARNEGARVANGDIVIHVSADAILAPDWIETATQRLGHIDMVYGRQIHAPRVATWASAMRGSRYDFPDHVVSDPWRLASNVAAAYRREALLAHPFVDDESALEDLIIARRLVDAGQSVAYDPTLTAWHRDAESLATERNKVKREGEAWGLHRAHVGAPPMLKPWLAAILVAVVYAFLYPQMGAPLLLVIVWLPTLRRVARYRGVGLATRARALLLGPPLDLLFAWSYARGRLQATTEAIGRRMLRGLRQELVAARIDLPSAPPLADSPRASSPVTQATADVPRSATSSATSSVTRSATPRAHRAASTENPPVRASPPASSRATTRNKPHPRHDVAQPIAPRQVKQAPRPGLARKRPTPRYPTE